MSELQEMNITETITLQELMDMVWKKRKEIIDVYAKRFIKRLVDIQKGYNITAYNGNVQKVKIQIGGTSSVNTFCALNAQRNGGNIIEQMDEDFPEFSVSILNERMERVQCDLKGSIHTFYNLNRENEKGEYFEFFEKMLTGMDYDPIVDVYHNVISTKKRLFRDPIYRVKVKFKPCFDEIFTLLQKYNNDNDIHFTFYKEVDLLVGTQDKYNIFEEVETKYRLYPFKIFICVE